MKLSDYARKLGINYRTAWNHYKQGKIKNAYQLPSGTIIVDDIKPNIEELVATYARVSSSENKNNLEQQSLRLREFCIANGWKIHKEVKEIGSGLNDNRKKLLSLIVDPKVTKIVVEHGDRFSRFGRKIIEELLKMQNRELVIINQANTDKDDLMDDFVAIITSFVARLYGLRRSKRRTEEIIQSLQAK